MTRPLIIGIAGGSGCGKTHLARQIAEEAGDGYVSVLSMDQYFLTEHEGPPDQINFDHPSHLDFDRMIREVNELKQGKSVVTPAYDFTTMLRLPQGITITPNRVVILEGLFVLAEPLVSLCDLTCFLDVATDERLLGRILRDTRERNATIEQVVDRYQRFVRPSYQIFVKPTMQNADVVVDFTHRRSFFTQLLIHFIRDSVQDLIDPEAFIATLKRESYAIGANMERGYMPLAVNILDLAKAYPEITNPMPSPALTAFQRGRVPKTGNSN